MTDLGELEMRSPAATTAVPPWARPTRLWQLELRGTLARRRALLIKLGFPLVLVIPLATTGAPPFFAAMLLTVLTAMVGTVGTGVAVTRARGTGWLDRLAVLPLPAWRVGLELFLAGWLVDCLQATLVLAVIAVVERPDPATLVTTWLVALAALAFSGTIGLGIAALTDHAGEAMLYLAVVLAPLLFLAGIFTGVPAGGPRFVAAQLLPFSYLDEGFQLLLGGNPPYGDPLGLLIAAAAFLVLSLVVTAALGRAVLARQS
ncbi:MAG TPA: ABC transporter permease [Candidatus Dormibacteraeota bacterium]|nr:ABC transporter permease [Candidatus Dormibacteraeota bacterium]